MKLPLAIFYVSATNILLVHAKIHGGPRGRFDKQYQRKPVVNHHVSAHHTHYTYHPPSRINFMCRHCAAMGSYPVYHGLPPTYVYKYRESGSRFGELLTGLALYNLGRASEYWHQTHYYTPRSDEKCSLQVIDLSAHFEETPFPCFMMSSFLQQAEIHGSESFDISTSNVNIKPFLQAKGSPLEVTREQECVIWHNTTNTTTKERSVIACALLKEYSKTMKPSGLPVYIWLPITVAIVILISLCCQLCCKKKRDFKELTPLNDKPVLGYCPVYD